MTRPKIEIIAEGLNFPEGPVFDQRQNLWCTELLSGNLVKVDNERLDRFPVGENVNGMAIDQNGIIWFTDSQKHTINTFDPADKRATLVLDQVEGEKLNRPNDLVFDHLGNLLVSCHADGRTEPKGYLMVLDRSRNAREISTGKYFTNGITFLSDRTTMVFSETYAQRLWKATWDPEKAAIVEESPWVEVGGPTGPDGLATGPDDLIYVAVFGQGEIKVVQPDGKIVDVYQLPGTRPTSCCFHPQNHQELFVTEAEKGNILKLTLP